MNDPQCGTTRPPWEGEDNPDPTRAKVIDTPGGWQIPPADGRYPRRMADTPGGWQIPPVDGRLKSLAVYQTTTHPREFYWSEDKVIT